MTRDEIFAKVIEIVKPFVKEMHDWFGTPDWVKDQ